MSVKPTAQRISGTSGGVRLGNRPPNTPNTVATFGAQPGVSYQPPHVPRDPVYGCPPPWMIPPPPTHSTVIASPRPGGESGGGTSRLNTNASTFVPRKVTVTIKTQDGREVDFSNWKKDAIASPVVQNNTPSIHQTHRKRTSVVRMETVEAKKKRLAEEKEKKSALRKRSVEEMEKRVREAKEEWKAAEGERKNAPPSALGTARPIEDLGYISYPEGVTGPNPELNVNSKKGKFIYDREFLLQFMAVCTENPDVPLDIIGVEHYPFGRFHRYKTNSTSIPPQASTSSFEPGASSGFTMGQFLTLEKMTSEERFAMSQRSTSSTDGPDGNRTRAKRTRSKRGGERNQSNGIHTANMSNNQVTQDRVALGTGGIPKPRSESRGGDDAPPAMSEAKASEKIAEDIEEFFSVHNIDESEDYFTELPSKYHHRLVGKMISKAIESKETGGELVAHAFARAAKNKLCSISAFEEGFLSVAELLDDIVIDFPEAFQIMATMMKGAGLDKDEERRAKIAQKCMDSNELLDLLA